MLDQRISNVKLVLKMGVEIPTVESVRLRIKPTDGDAVTSDTWEWASGSQTVTNSHGDLSDTLHWRENCRNSHKIVVTWLSTSCPLKMVKMSPRLQNNCRCACPNVTRNLLTHSQFEIATLPSSSRIDTSGDRYPCHKTSS